MKKYCAEWESEFLQYVELLDEQLDLRIEDVHFRLRSNSYMLLKTLETYFSHLAIESKKDLQTIVLVEHPLIKLTDIDLKEATGGFFYTDLNDGRLIQHQATGMVFLQSSDVLIAVGPCESSPEQIVNFIITQYKNSMWREGWIEAALGSIEVRGIGVALFEEKGGGKDALSFAVMEEEEARYLSQKSLFLNPLEEVIIARGVPEVPIVNAAMLAESDKLSMLLPYEQRKETENLSPLEKEQLESQFEIDINVHYGIGRIVQETAIEYLFILNWSRMSDDPVSIKAIDHYSPELYSQLCKFPAPFYLGGKDESVEPYQKALKALTVYQVSGGFDLETVKKFLLEKAAHI